MKAAVGILLHFTALLQVTHGIHEYTIYMRLDGSDVYISRSPYTTRGSDVDRACDQLGFSLSEFLPWDNSQARRLMMQLSQACVHGDIWLPSIPEPGSFNYTARQWYTQVVSSDILDTSDIGSPNTCGSNPSPQDVCTYMTPSTPRPGSPYQLRLASCDSDKRFVCSHKTRTIEPSATNQSSNGPGSGGGSSMTYTPSPSNATPNMTMTSQGTAGLQTTASTNYTTFPAGTDIQSGGPGSTVTPISTTPPGTNRQSGQSQTVNDAPGTTVDSSMIDDTPTSTQGGTYAYPYSSTSTQNDEDESSITTTTARNRGTTSAEFTTTENQTGVASASNCSCNIATASQKPPVVDVRTNVSQQEILEIQRSIEKNLTVDKSSLSATVRKKTSAQDSRPSSRVAGVIGLMSLTLTFGSVIIVDLAHLVQVVLSHLIGKA